VVHGEFGVVVSDGAGIDHGMAVCELAVIALVKVLNRYGNGGFVKVVIL
jgi:hypothetical protein